MRGMSGPGYESPLPRYEGSPGMRGQMKGLKVQQQQSFPSWWFGIEVMGVDGKAKCPEKNKSKKSLTHLKTMPQAAGNKQLIKTFI